MTMPKWTAMNPSITVEHLGLIPMMLDVDNPQSARDQLNAGYQHGGGWHPFAGFRIDKQLRLHYSGDPPTNPIAYCMLRDEKIVLYEHAWVAIIQPNGYYEIARMD